LSQNKKVSQLEFRSGKADKGKQNPTKGKNSGYHINAKSPGTIFEQ